MEKRPAHRPINLRNWQNFYDLCRSVSGPHGFTVSLLSAKMPGHTPRAISTKLRRGIDHGYFHAAKTKGCYKLGAAPIPPLDLTPR